MNVILIFHMPKQSDSPSKQRLMKYCALLDSLTLSAFLPSLPCHQGMLTVVSALYILSHFLFPYNSNQFKPRSFPKIIWLFYIRPLIHLCLLLAYLIESDNFSIQKLFIYCQKRITVSIVLISLSIWTDDPHSAFQQSFHPATSPAFHSVANLSRRTTSDSNFFYL